MFIVPDRPSTNTIPPWTGRLRPRPVPDDEQGTGMAGKRDFKKELDCYRAKVDTPQLVEVPELQYLMIDGHGDPNTPAFGEAVAALYPVAYKLKFASKQTLDRDYVVMPLEGLWWAEDMDTFTSARDKSRWSWTLMTMVPGWITADMLTTATEKVAAKNRPARLDDVRLGTLREGLCVQALHLGSFDDEAPLIETMHQFIRDNCLVLAGRHHEIYLSDRSVEPARQRTILRQPVGRAIS
jgi:hypothetical protein